MTIDPHQVLHSLENSYRHISDAINVAQKMKWKSEERQSEHINFLQFVQTSIREEIHFYRTELRKR